MSADVIASGLWYRSTMSISEMDASDWEPRSAFSTLLQAFFTAGFLEVQVTSNHGLPLVRELVNVPD